jgi:hypothetical protein
MSKFKVGDTIVTTDGKKENKWYKVLSIVINETLNVTNCLDY